MTPAINCEALRDDLIALLYEDGDPTERSRARDHLAQCVPCRTEYADLKAVRKDLSTWSLPTASAPLRPRRVSPWFSAGLAAAAGLILGIGVALVGRSVFVGLSSSPPAASAQGAPQPSSRDASAVQFVSYADLEKMLQAQESRHQAEIAELRESIIETSGAGPTSEASARTASNLSPATLDKLLRASEARQAQMFEARLASLRTQNDLQRQYDMAQIAAGLAYIDSRTGADAARTSELMKNLVRVTAKPQDR